MVNTPLEPPPAGTRFMRPERLIAELHASGYSNRDIAYLVAQHGLTEPVSERTVRRWAMRDGDPRLSEWMALQALHVVVFGKSAAACSAERD